MLFAEVTESQVNRLVEALNQQPSAAPAYGIGINVVVGVVTLAVLGLVLKAVFSYIRSRDEKDTLTHKQCEDTIQTVVSNHRDSLMSVTKSFESQLDKEREWRAKDNDLWRQTMAPRGGS